MARAKIHRITVSGRGEFPMDMLRYDECYPYSVEDISLMTERTCLREITLVCHRPCGSTYARWDSFGWEVIAQILH